MKKRAILVLATTLILFEAKFKTVYGQDTIVAGSFTSTESFNSMTDALEIMQEALKEQLKALEKNSDSLKYYMEFLNDQMKKIPDPFSIPDDIAKNYGNDFEREQHFEMVDLKGDSKTRNILINVEKEIPFMFLIIKGELNSGKAIIEIYTPNNIQKGSFKIENIKDENNQSVNSSINKIFKKPIIGEWKVKVQSDKAFGNIIITSIQKL